MRLIWIEKRSVRLAVLFALLLRVGAASGQTLATRGKDSPQNQGGPVHIPNRPSTPLFRGKQGKQNTEIHYDPATHQVTLKLLIQDPNGYFIPNVRRENFAVYENGVRQHIASVDVEDAPVSLGLLLEFGGRYLPLNRALGAEVTGAARQLLDVMTQQDRIAIWKYNNKVEKVSDFSQNRDSLYTQIYALGNPEFSETNLFDAVSATIDQMGPVKGRKAIVLISSGIDTFSKTTRQDALAAAQKSDSPTYVISLSTYLREIVDIDKSGGPSAVIDWRKAEANLQDLARDSGGRAYFPKNTIDLSPIYADIMENIKVRYVITYESSTDADLNSPRTVRVDLVNPRTGEPLQIVDSSGNKIYAQVILQQNYVPKAAGGTD